MELPALDGTALDRLGRLGGGALLRNMIALYLEHGPGRLAALRAGLDADDAVAVERAAHALKSSAGNLGARRLQHTAETVEALAAGGVLDAELVTRLATEFEESAVLLRSVLEDEGS